MVTGRGCSETESGQERVNHEWHRVVVIDERMAAFAESHLQKGDQVYIEGQLHTECWQDETYQWRSLTKILLWEESGQLRKLTPGDDITSARRTSDPGLAVAREAHLIDTSTQDSWLGKSFAAQIR
ncbi:MAG: single-stranded DNA-binding protein [Geminicoccaceae bacterium]